ncbi:MAG TPA: hypothetical protein VGC54_06555 [Planctomycetota bacterium]
MTLPRPVTVSFRCAAGAAALLLIAGSARTQQPDVVYHDEERSFTIAAPAAGWSFHPNETGAFSPFELVVRPPGGDGSAQFTLRVGPTAGIDDPAQYVDQLLATVATQPGYGAATRVEMDVAGRRAPGFEIDTTAPTGVFRVRQLILVDQGRRYVLQAHAPPADFAKWREAFDRTQASFAFLEPSAERSEALRVRALAARCGREIDWAKDWEDAAHRARSGRRPVVVVVSAQGAFDTGDPLGSGAFSDPDVVALVRSRFVALKLPPDLVAPFYDRAVYGLSRTTFGKTILITDPDGTVIAERSILDRATILDLLLEVAQSEPAPAVPALKNGGQRPARIAWHLDSGNLNKAAEMLDGMQGRDAALLGARLHRMRRDGEAGLRALDALAYQPGEDLELDLRRAELQMRMGRFEEARSAYAAVAAAAPPESVYAAEANFLLGRFAFLVDENETAAFELWRTILAKAPDGPWLWKAAACISHPAMRYGSGDRSDWPSEAQLAAVRDLPFAPLPPARAERARADAQAWLLAGQRDDGSWSSPEEALGTAKGAAGEHVLAKTALAAHALLAHLDEPGVRPAVERALAFLEAQQDLRAEQEEVIRYMDYGVWRLAMLLRFYPACIQAGVGDADALRTRMQGQVADLLRRQRGGGGWSYTWATSLEHEGGPPDESISFTTASALLGLQDAAAAGIPVDAAALARGLACLSNMRNPSGTFEYMARGDASAARGGVGPVGAAGRGPLCALPLWRAGIEELADVRHRLEIFADHHQVFGAERGKGLMHTGADTQGSHYLLYDYALAAEAAAALPRAQRRRLREPILTELLGCRVEGGAFTDNPLLGRDFGAAMALRALDLMLAE